jgi:hypothetical protein
MQGNRLNEHLNGAVMSPEESQSSQKLHRYAPLAVWSACIVTLLLVPLRIRQYGYTPSDDANRHIAKAISGKTWNEILVMRDEITIDTNAGWHAILRALNQGLGWDADVLMTFSIASLFLLVTFTGLWVVRRPEAWMAAFLFIQTAHPGLVVRLSRARPYVFSIAVLLAVLGLWGERRKSHRAVLVAVVTIGMISVAVWIHGSWYLFALPAGALLMTRRVRDSFYYGCCWIVGSIIGACLTHQPIEFMWQQVRWALDAFGHSDVQRLLVSEFQPSAGDPLIVLLVVAMLLWRKLQGRAGTRPLESPILMLALIGWTFGLLTARFWVDWGAPAVLLWTALELREATKEFCDRFPLERMGAAVFICVAFLFSTTSDLHSRWTGRLMAESVSADDPELVGWLPDDGGILYSADMMDFYMTFYENPHANWRYVLGYEPTTMKEDDLEIYRNIQWNYRATESYLPWVDKMGPSDRLLIPGDSKAKPDIPDLEWHYACRGRWIGRLPRTCQAEES